MAFDIAFLDEMNSRVAVKPAASRSAYGATGYGTPITGLRCRVSYKTRVIRHIKEEDIQATAVVWAPPPGYKVGTDPAWPKVGTQDLVILPDASERPVLSVDRPVDETGAIHHQRVYLA